MTSSPAATMPPTFDIQGCPLYLGDLRHNFGAWLRARDYSQIILLCDTNTRRACLPIFLEKTGLSANTPVVEIPAGEAHKTLATAEKVWQQMLAARLDRRALVINLGGGVIGDLGGFCAATWKRGVAFAQVPSTLLSMTDAAIGGKLGIDFQGVKNTIGVFQHPAAVFADPDFLTTLPAHELRSGFAEVLKHALIGDPQLWQSLRESTDADQALRTLPWLEVLRQSIAVKARVVQEDPLEKGLRMLLNYGHTIGHAVESCFLETENPLAHGEAVALGIICETYLAPAIGSPALVAEISGTILRHFPHRPVPRAAFPAIWEWMQQDKKNAAGAVRMALPDALPYSMRVLPLDRAAMERGLAFYNQLGG
jgi:3-dehydroquinate synthase